MDIQPQIIRAQTCRGASYVTIGACLLPESPYQGVTTGLGHVLWLYRALSELDLADIDLIPKDSARVTESFRVKRVRPSTESV